MADNRNRYGQMTEITAQNGDNILYTESEGQSNDSYESDTLQRTMGPFSGTDQVDLLKPLS